MCWSNLNVMLAVTLVIWGNVVEWSQSTWTSYEAFQFFNETIEESAGSDVELFAFMNVAFGSIYARGGSSGSGMDCWGSRSCQSLKVLETNEYSYTQDSRGYLSLAWTKNVTHQDCCGLSVNTMCHGEAACYHIDTLTLDGQPLTCNSARGCNHIGGIYGISSNVNVYGTYSMINTTLYTRGDGSTINFYYYSYFAGYNSNIYCNNGDTCNLYCESNACVNLNFNCDESVSTCNVYCDNSDYCANNWNDNSDNSDYDMYNSVSLIDDSGELLSLLTKRYDEYDWYEDCIEGSQYTCINGSTTSACYDTSFIDSEGSSITHAICCSAYQSCYGSIFEMNDANADVYCDASDSCANIQIDLNHQSSVYARGRYSIGNSMVKNFVKMVVSTWEAYASNVNNGIYLSCLGYQSCYQFIISNVSTIFATGYRSLYQSTINSNGNDVNIYLLGYKAGYGLTINCEVGDKCNVYCLDGTNDECLNDITIETPNPTASPTTEPTKAPTHYVEYSVSMNVSTTAIASNNNKDKVTFYVKLEGDSDDTEWSEIEVDESTLTTNTWQQITFWFNWLYIGTENIIMSMVTYDINTILFGCFTIESKRNNFTQTVCADGTTKLSVSSEEYKNGYCAYASIDFSKLSIRVRTSNDVTGCPYVTSAGTVKNDISTLMNFAVFGIIGAGFLTVAASKAWTEKKTKNGADDPPIGTILKFSLQLSDFWSDIGLTAVWYYNGNDFYAISSTIILLLSTLVSIFGAIQLTSKWKHYDNHSRDCPERLVNYVSKYEKMIYILCIMAGIKPTMALLQSKLFSRQFFNLPLKRDELGLLYKYHVAVVIVETLPEFALQIYYLIENGTSGDNDSDLVLLIVSLVLSIISILVEMMVFVSRRQRDGASSNAFVAQTIFDFEINIQSPELKKYHILTNDKLNACLKPRFKNKNYPWQSKADLCKFSLECYYIEDKLTSDEIEIHCQIIIGTTHHDTADIETGLTACVKDLFDHGSENHKKLKKAICNKLKIEIEDSEISRSDEILIRHSLDEKRHMSVVKQISTLIDINKGGQSSIASEIASASPASPASENNFESEGQPNNTNNTNNTN